MSNQDTAVSLESYATVMAGLGAGLDLRSALAHADLSPSEWDSAAPDWHSRIDESAASDLTLLVAFDAVLLAAKRRFEPAIEPIESDARAWACFRRHFATAVDPLTFLAGHEISPTVYARLEADWANRALADEDLAASLRQYLLEPLASCPTLTRSPRRTAESAAPAAPAAALVPSMPQPVAPAPATVLSMPQPAAPVPVIVPSMPQPAAPVPATVPPMRRAVEPEPPSETLDCSPDEGGRPSLPFKNIAPPVPLERYAVMLADAAVFGMTDAALCQKHGIDPADKARAFSYWEEQAGADAATRERVRAVMDRYCQASRSRPQPPLPRAAREISSTIDTIPAKLVPAGPPLPFRPAAPGDPRAAVTPETARRTPTKTPPSVDVSATGPVDLSKLGIALPFAGQGKTGPRPGARPSSAAPPAQEPPFGLTLEQHACLRAELDRSPAHAPVVLARYRVTQEQATVLHAWWRERFAAERDIEARWEEAYRRYGAYLDSLPAGKRPF